MVLDLSGLPNGVERVNPYNSDFRAAHNAYIINADYTFGLAQTTGRRRSSALPARTTNSGNYRLYSLRESHASAAPERLDAGLRARSRLVPGDAMRARTLQCANADRPRPFVR